MSYKGGKKSNVYEVEEGYDLWAEKYEEGVAFLNSFEKDVFLKFLGQPQGKKILDLGCGTGRILKNILYGENEVTGMDISEKMLEIAKKNFPRVKFVKGDITEMPFGEDSFDLVICNFVIVHAPNLDKVFDEVYRILKPGGIFLLTNINQKKGPKLSLSNKRDIVIKSFYHRPEDVLKQLEKSFFTIEKEEFIVENDIWINQIIRAKK